jgi:hypothetical protein
MQYIESCYSARLLVYKQEVFPVVIIHLHILKNTKLTRFL